MKQNVATLREVREQSTKKSRSESSLKTPAKPRPKTETEKALATSTSSLDAQDVIRKEQEALLEEADALLDLFTKRQSDSRMSSASEVSSCSTRVQDINYSMVDQDKSFEADIVAELFLDEASGLFKLFDALEIKVERALKYLEECSAIAVELDNSNKGLMDATKEMNALADSSAKSKVRLSVICAEQKELLEQILRNDNEEQAVRVQITASAKGIGTQVDRLKTGLDNGSDHVKEVSEGVQTIASTAKKAAAKHYEKPEQKTVRLQFSSVSVLQALNFVINIDLNLDLSLHTFKHQIMQTFDSEAMSDLITFAQSILAKSTAALGVTATYQVTTGKPQSSMPDPDLLGPRVLQFQSFSASCCDDGSVVSSVDGSTRAASTGGSEQGGSANDDATWNELMCLVKRAKVIKAY